MLQLHAWLQACTIRVITPPMLMPTALSCNCFTCNMSALLQIMHQFCSNLSHIRMTYSQSSGSMATFVLHATLLNSDFMVRLDVYVMTVCTHNYKWLLSYSNADTRVLWNGTHTHIDTFLLSPSGPKPIMSLCNHLFISNNRCNFTYCSSDS